MTLTLQTYWAYLAVCCLSQVLLPTHPASFLREQTHPAREKGCPSVFLKLLYFKKDGLGEWLKGWRIRGKSQREGPQHTPTPLPNLLFI